MHWRNYDHSNSHHRYIFLETNTKYYKVLDYYCGRNNIPNDNGIYNTIRAGSSAATSLGGKHHQNFEGHQTSQHLLDSVHHQSGSWTSLWCSRILLRWFIWSIRFCSPSISYYRSHIWGCFREHFEFLYVRCQQTAVPFLQAARNEKIS